MNTVHISAEYDLRPARVLAITYGDFGNQENSALPNLTLTLTLTLILALTIN